MDIPTIHLKYVEMNSCLVHITSSKPVFVADSYINSGTNGEDTIKLMAQLVKWHYESTDFTCHVLIDPMFGHLSEDVIDRCAKKGFTPNVIVGEKFE